MGEGAGAHEERDEPAAILCWVGFDSEEAFAGLLDLLDAQIAVDLAFDVVTWVGALQLRTSCATIRAC